MLRRTSVFLFRAESPIDTYTTSSCDHRSVLPESPIDLYVTNSFFSTPEMPESEDIAEFQEQQMISQETLILFEDTDEEDISDTNLPSSEQPTLEKPTDAETVTATELPMQASATLPSFEHRTLQKPTDAKAMAVTKVNSVAAAQKQYMQTISDSPEKWKLMEACLPTPNVNDPYTIRVDSGAGQITIEGEELAVIDATCKVYEILSSISEDFLPDVSPEVASLFLTPEGQARLAKSSFNGVLNVRHDGVYLMAYSASADETAKSLKDLIHCRRTTVLELYYDFLRSPEYQKLVDELQSKFTVHIKSYLEDRNILISGIEVDAATEELQVKLKEKAVTTDTLQVTSGIGRFIMTYQRDLQKNLQSR